MLKTGQVLNNHYQIHAILGEGGFGAVYKVWNDNLQRLCAIKENQQVSAESQKQFKRDAIMPSKQIFEVSETSEVCLVFAATFHKEDVSWMIYFIRA
jgi:serine/threonine protein kinase